jgi:hypothetical protein
LSMRWCTVQENYQEEDCLVMFHLNFGVGGRVGGCEGVRVGEWESGRVGE